MKKPGVLFITVMLWMSLVNAQSTGNGTLSPLALEKIRISNDYLSNLSALANNRRGGAPEQDCINAIPICQQSYSQTTSYTGFGNVDDLFPNVTCLSTGETNSVWYVFTAQTSGSFVFNIQTVFDYDFALYNITNTGCNLGGVTPLRCNYSADFGGTGLQLPTASGNITYGAGDPAYMPGVDVQAGETYVLIVNNWTGDQTGYTITFGGTASIFDNNPPGLADVEDDCTVGTLTLNTTEPIDCGSISSANVNITGPAGGSVTSVVGVGCGGFTTQIQINYTLSTTLNGTYTVSVSGLVDNCGNVMPLDSLDFNVLQDPMPVATPSSICAGSSASAVLSIDSLPSGFSASWSNGATGISTTVNPATTTTYTVTVSNANCSKTGSVTVDVTNAPSVSISPQNATSCSGGPVALTANAPAGATFLWNTGENTASINAVSSGLYSVTVTDAGGCQGFADKEVFLSNLNVTAVISDVSCFGENDGAVDLTVTGGIPPYSYVWSNGFSDEDLTGLAAGTYEVTVSDSIGCTVSNSYMIAEPSMLLLNLSGDDVTCGGANDGAIDLSVSGGTPPYSYLWSTAETSEDINGLAGGAYFVTVTDSNNCSATSGLTLDEPDSLIVIITTTDVSCNGLNDGTVDLSVSGGVGSYTYTWNNGETSQDLTAVGAGIYVVTVTDANNCTATASGEVSELQGISLSYTSQDVGCNGGNDGAIDLTVTGGASPYGFDWSNGEASEDLTGLIAGTYDVLVTDANGCTASDTILINEPSVMILSISSDDVTCNGENDGSAEAIVSGGTPPYQYAWNTGATSADLSGLAAGLYAVTVTDDNGCVAVDSVNISEPSALNASSIENSVACSGGNDGSIDISVSGGTSPYNYLWNTGQTSEDLQGVSAGSYTLTITDANGCTSSLSATVTEPTALSITGNVTDASCFGCGDGAIDCSVSGGTSPYGFNWSNGELSEDLTGLTAGQYDLTVMDANGCTATARFMVEQPFQFDLLLSATDNSVCHVDVDTSCECDGKMRSFTVVYNGPDSVDIEAYENSGQDNLLQTFSNVQNGDVLVVEATSLSGGQFKARTYLYNADTGEETEVHTSCSQDILGLTLGDFSVIGFVDGAGNTCGGIPQESSCNGTIEATVQGGLPPFSYSWSTGDSSAVLNDLCAGTYYVTVVDANGTSATDSAIVSDGPAFTLSFTTVNDSSCTNTSQPLPPCECECDGKMQNITVKYVGTDSVDVEVYNGSGHNILLASFSNVQNGDILFVEATANGGQFESNTYFQIVGGDEISIHTSCSRDVGGQTFGDFEVTGFTDGAGGVCDLSGGCAGPCGCEGDVETFTVEYVGVSGADVNVYGSSGHQDLLAFFANVQNGDLLTVGTAGIALNDKIYFEAAGQPDVKIYTKCGSKGGTKDDIGKTLGDFTVAGYTDSQGNACGSAGCEGTGSVSLTVSGGQAPFTIQWSNGATGQNIEDLCEGTYTVTVTDANGCSETDTVTINQVNPDPFTLSFTTVADSSCDNTNPLPPCECDCNGKMQNITVKYVGADSVDVEVYNGSGHNILLASFNNVQNGDILFVEATANGGQFESNTYFQIVGGDEISIHTSCSRDVGGQTFGDFEVTGFTDGAGGVCDLSGGCAGPCGCEGDVETFTVEYVGASGADVNVYGNGGHQDLLASFADVQNGDMLTVGTAGTALNDKIYFEVIGQPDVKIYTKCGSKGGTKDDIGKTLGDFTVAGYTDSEGNACGAAGCAGTGVASVAVSGGHGPFIFEWSNGATEQDITGLCEGTYSVTVTDANGCFETGDVVIDQAPSSLSISAIVTPDANCDSTITPLPPCECQCDGKMQNITVKYVGADSANIEVYNGSGHNILLASFSNVQNGDVLFVEATANGGQFESNTYFQIVGGDEISIHTSCSRDVGGQTFGDFEVTGFTDGAGGVCDLSGGCAGPCGCEGDVETFTVEYVGASGADVNVYGNSGHQNLLASFTGVQSGDLLTVGTPGTVLNDKIYFEVIGQPDVKIYTKCGSKGGTKDPVGETLGDFKVSGYTDSEGNACGVAKCEGTGAITLNVLDGKAPFTFAWSTGDMTQNIQDLCPGTYVVTVTDGYGCSIEDTFEVGCFSDSCEIALNAQVMHESCEGANDGSIALSPAGGVPPYDYLWSDGSSGSQIDNLIPGQYAVTVTDSAGCETSASFVINAATELLVNIRVSNTIPCNGGTDGELCADISGGTPPYSFVWSNSASGQCVDSLASGAYSVTVADDHGCTVSQENFLLDEPSAIQLSFAVVDVTCFGATDGKIDLTVSGGTSPYSYIWSNGPATQDITGLAAGSYSVTVTDDNGCVKTGSATVNQPVPLSLGAVTTPVTCSGGSDGAIDLQVDDGTPPYFYQWTTGDSVQDINGFTAGMYEVTVTDANGCDAILDVEVMQPRPIGLSAAITDVGCSGGNDGAIDLTVAGGTSPYGYTWSNGASTQDISNLNAGLYAVTVTDDNGCSALDSFIVHEPSAVNVTLQATQISCPSENDGALCVQATGGTPPYSYQWVNGAATGCIDNLSAGTYTVTITDANGCTAVASDTLTEPDPIIVTIATTDVSCYGLSDGSAETTVTGGTPPYSFLWDNGSTQEDLIGVLPAGPISLVVMDSAGCNSSASASVNQPDSLSLSLSVQNVSCAGTGNGSIDLTVMGGTTPYSYSWSNGANTADISGLSEGVYSVTVADSNGCAQTAAVTVSEPDTILLTGRITRVSCFGANDGGVDLTVQGGTSPFFYEWSNGTATQDLAGVTAGNYTVTVTDINGCTEVEVFNVDQPAPLAVGFVATPVSCSGGTDGAIDLTLQGGTPPYGYAWSTGESTQDIGSLEAGFYEVTVTDSNGCDATIIIEVDQPQAITLSVSVQDVSCPGGNDGMIDLSVVGGTSPYAYTWSNGESTEDISGLTAGDYMVTVMDDNGCTAIDTFSVAESPGLTLNINMDNPISCFGAGDGAICVAVSGGIPPYTYSWSPSGSTNCIDNLGPGSYSVTVTDNNGCTASQQNFVLTEPDELSISGTTMDANCVGASDGVVDISVTGGTPPYSYSWSNGLSTEDLNGVVAGTYTVTVTDANGCFLSGDFTVGQPAPLALGANTYSVSCFGGSDGAIDLLVFGGTPPYGYDWSTGDTAQDISGLEAGSYTVVVYDSNGCNATLIVPIIEPDEITLSALVNDVTIIGGNDGSIDLSVIGGTSPYSYAWSNGDTTQDINNLSAGVYSVTLTDDNGCTAMDTFDIADPARVIQFEQATANTSLFDQQPSGDENLTFFEAEAYPNPFFKKFNLVIKSKKEGHAKIRLVDLFEREVFFEKAGVKKGDNLFEISLRDLPSGMYFIVVNMGDQHTVIKVENIAE